eukprot:CAMPEP_0204864056 /NCGR_PEP_ID=MMETSP1348-20121228/3788_1 /ASSEMBLY_ACC=CAM_ASM_000700 /TAXON_ID=215587 /ORGANISM="Aplanochytrium stocchinoi, Strain GSBS06" /LENGTH=537 /DNA_ID=CAMNT_0052014581 /DNA_START=25 /DNA_END=1635 /DNA_ORIENTATION=+
MNKKKFQKTKSFWDKGTKEDKAKLEDLVSPYEGESFASVFGETGDHTVSDINESAGSPALQISPNDAEQDLERLRSRLASRGPSYRVPLEKEEANEMLSDEKGQIWYAKIVDTGFDHPKYVLKDGSLKPRRPLPHIFRDDFFNSIEGSSDGRWIFNGNLNDWPALSSLEVIQLEYWYSKKVGGQDLTYSKRFWKKGDNSEKPYFPDAGQGFFKIKPDAIRATLKAPSWSHIGYSKDNPGFVFWYAQCRDGGPRVSHGENIIKAARNDAASAGTVLPEAVAAHFFGHRYAKVNENAKDLFTYHTAVLLEWDHEQFTTVVELAYQYGLGGYGGKSNWVEDRDAKPMPALFEAMPGSLKAPWKTDRSEIRIIDVPARNLEEFKAYLHKYEGPKKRFVDPQIKYSGPITISMRSQDAIFRYILNYSIRDITYSEEFHNCQSFAADFYGFLCDNNDAEPYHPVKILYTPRRDLFLYAPNNYEDNLGLKWIDVEKIIAKTKDMKNFVETKNSDMKNMISESGENMRALFQKGLEVIANQSHRW